VSSTYPTYNPNEAAQAVFNIPTGLPGVPTPSNTLPSLNPSLISQATLPTGSIPTGAYPIPTASSTSTIPSFNPQLINQAASSFPTAPMPTANPGTVTTTTTNTMTQTSPNYVRVTY